METQSIMRGRSIVSYEELAGHEIVARILKLRWMGMETEAKQMENALCKVEPKETLLAGPCDTD